MYSLKERKLILAQNTIKWYGYRLVQMFFPGIANCISAYMYISSCFVLQSLNTYQTLSEQSLLIKNIFVSSNENFFHIKKFIQVDKCIFFLKLYEVLVFLFDF